MLKLKDETLEYDCECLKDLFEKIDVNTYSENTQFFEENSSEISQIIKDKTFRETDRILSHYNLLNILFLSEKYLEELKKCIKK